MESLKRALDVIDLAATELPLTSRISKALPDDFSAACQKCWGSSTNGYVAVPDLFESALLAENIEVVKSEDVLPHDADTPPVADEGEWSNTIPTTDWQPAPSATLLALFGPTTLPMTHALGAVERSVRRILFINPPDETNNTAAAGGQALFARMCAVEMAPWLDCQPEDTALILRAGNKSHALENRITLLVSPSVAEHLKIGMGIGGDWVQLACLSPEEEDGSQSGEDIWFLERLTSVLPSYWLV